MRIAIVLLALASSALAQQEYETAPKQPEIALERYGLPSSLLADGELLSDLATRTGVAGTQLEGLRLRIALPLDFRVESVHMQVVDGIFLVREDSFFSAVGGFLMRVARLLLFGQLVNVSDGLEVPSALWFVLLDGDPTKDEPVSVKTKQAISIDADDRRISDHGDFIVCRLIAATSPFTEIVGLEIRGRHRDSGERLRYLMPRLAIPPMASKIDSREFASQSALASWLAASP